MREARPSDGHRRYLPGWWWRGGEAIGYGRLLGSASLLSTAAALTVLRPAGVDWTALTAVGGFHLVALALSFSLPWRRWSTWALLAFPLASLLAITLAALAVPALAGAMSGFFVLSFAYAGLYLPARGGLVLLVPAIAAYAGQSVVVTPQVWVRTFFVAAAWIALAELLNRLQLRHAVLVRQLRADAQIDPLTGLANRRGMERFLAQAEPGDLLVVFDLDNFKRLNDEQGHAFGDEVLRTFGRLLLNELRTRDHAARSGGEEMVALLRCRELDRCGETFIRRLRAALVREGLGVTFSAGLAQLRPGQTVTEALEDADRATYCAKHAGRDQVWLAGEPRQGVPDVPLARHGEPVGRVLMAG
ncbi:GGDEF domain-containing protein [Modestobacter sp. NPDC049651]|uniref:GGDEF domain-containing protein n=1 Tax=unclassified Modestobacter TaxID=2643866 RepID=UPI00340EC8D1